MTARGLRGFILGVVAVLVVFAAAGYAAVMAGLMPANADGKPSKVETWAAKNSLRATIKREAPRGPNPVPATIANYTRGITLYRENCAVCHGAADGKASNIAKGLYIGAPQLAKHGVEDDPAGVTFWKIKHGIRFTGMPSYGATLSDEQIWQTTLFLQHMDQLPPEARQAWKAVPSQAAPASATARERPARGSASGA